MAGPCFYCLDEKTSICICLKCRTKLENAEAELKRLRNEMEVRKRAYFKKLNEIKRESKRPK